MDRASGSGTVAIVEGVRSPTKPWLSTIASGEIIRLLSCGSDARSPCRALGPLFVEDQSSKSVALGKSCKRERPMPTSPSEGASDTASARDPLSDLLGRIIRRAAGGEPGGPDDGTRSVTGAALRRILSGITEPRVFGSCGGTSTSSTTPGAALVCPDDAVSGVTGKDSVKLELEE